jgi:hypothetical protein
MNHLKTISCNASNPERIDEEFKNWRDSMKNNQQKIVDIISTSMACNDNRLFVSIIYQYSEIFEKKIIIEKFNYEINGKISKNKKTVEEHNRVLEYNRTLRAQRLLANLARERRSISYDNLK